VGLDTLHTCKRVVAWFPGLVEDTGRYLQRLRKLNRGLDTENYKVYELKEEPNKVLLVLIIDSNCITALEMLGWRRFNGVDQTIVSLPAHQTRKGEEETEVGKMRERLNLDIVSII